MRPGLRSRSRHLAFAAALLLVLAGTVAPGSAQARRIFVPRQHKLLQSAIDAARAGDTVWVAAGTYYGPLVLKKQIVLFGDGGPDKTILDGKGNARVLHVEGISRGAIVGFRIQNGKAAGGSGIYCLRDTAFLIAGCKIRDNWEAGVATWQCAPLQIVESEITGNKGSGVTANDSRIQMIRVLVRGNESPTGGGMALTSSEVILRDCKFEENRASDGTGGGIYGEDDSSIRTLNCVFRGNRAAAGGGAIAGRDSSDVRIRTTLFAENHASTGGAILTDMCTLDLMSSIFTKNRSTTAGSALQIMGRRVAGVNPLISMNTFYRNGVEAPDGAAIFSMDVAPEIVRNIFVVDSTEKNRAVLEMRGVPRYECNLVYSPDGPLAPPTATTIVGNPSFCDAEKEDFHLRDLSPALVGPCGRLGALGKGCTTFRMLPSQ
ncbi:MAG TPA: right-handed parallel beta-helix repeat-containing protein [Candidatus Dormibacteraeota bacterium]|nr:right-handed parallel beta-helix repeat-containing protein [Candidatus Dormibacteraeota bacterium]